METVKIRDDFIRLGQLLKLAGMVSSGIEAKVVIQEGLVKVNGEVELQRGKKLHPNDVVEYAGGNITVARQK